MADFSFGFTERIFLLFNGQKHLRSVAEDLINEFIKNGEGTNVIKLSSQYFSTGHNFADFHWACEINIT